MTPLLEKEGKYLIIKTLLSPPFKGGVPLTTVRGEVVDF
jgi:hypothetical protein